MPGWRDPYRDEHPLIRWLIWAGSWSLPIGRPLFGIRTRLHWTLILVPLLYGLFETSGDLLGNFITAIMFMLMVWGTVYLHELGHATTAMRCGYPVHEIVLYLMGGVAITGGTRNVNHDFAIIAFGPMVNFVLLGLTAVLFYGVVEPLGLTAANGYILLNHRYLSPDGFLWAFGFLNFVLGVFNLIPLFPLDGGGMLRALLSMKYNPNRVTHRMATIGQWVIVPAIVLFVLLSHNPALEWPLLFIAIMGFQACMWEKQRAKFTQIYHEPGYGGGGLYGSAFATPMTYGGWQESDNAGTTFGGWSAESADIDKENKKAAKEKKPGYFEKRRQKRLEKEAQKAASDRAKVEELLEKISREGITALSAREKEFLKNASKRYQG